MFASIFTILLLTIQSPSQRARSLQVHKICFQTVYLSEQMLTTRSGMWWNVTKRLNGNIYRHWHFEFFLCHVRIHPSSTPWLHASQPSVHHGQPNSIIIMSFLVPWHVSNMNKRLVCKISWWNGMMLVSKQAHKQSANIAHIAVDCFHMFIFIAFMVSPCWS